MRACLSLIGAALAACAFTGPAIAESFCVDGTTEWSKAEDLHGSLWTDKATNTIVGFLWKDKDKELWDRLQWPPGTELGLLWPPIADSMAELPDETIKKLNELQAIKIDFKEATADAPAMVSFNRIMVKLTGTGEYREDLTQTWKYVLTFAEDCQSMSGEIAMFKYNQGEASLTGRVSLPRTQ